METMPEVTPRKGLIFLWLDKNREAVQNLL